MVSTRGTAFGSNYSYDSTGWTEQVGGKKLSSAVYASVEDGDISAPVEAWFDLGSGLDMGRKVSLVWNKKKVKAHKDIELLTYVIAEDEFLPCPVSTKNCRYSGRYHGRAQDLHLQGGKKRRGDTVVK
jgi:hypothetical protein